MRCKTVIDLHMEDGYAGRDYSFVCQGCRQVVTELSPGRIVAMLSLILGMGILGGLLVGFGLAMLLNTLTKSSDSNQAMADSAIDRTAKWFEETHDAAWRRRRWLIVTSFVLVSPSPRHLCGAQRRHR
jgi:hypothetical protein